MGQFRIVVADAIATEGLAPLRDARATAGEGVDGGGRKGEGEGEGGEGQFEIVERLGLKGEELAQALRDADAVLVRSATRITRDSLKYADNLKVIGRAGVGVDTIDVDAATERGIAVLTAPSGNTISAAELAFALLLALVRKVPAADRSMKAGEWDRKNFNGVELYGKTLGLVGAGRVGGEVGRRARAFGMRVIASDPYMTADRAKSLEIELVPLAEVLKRADVLSLHVPLTEDTTGLIGEAELASMKPGAVLVNAARGGVVDEIALARFLVDGRLAGAALDVFEQEPLPADHPLRKLPNVVLCPHLGASTAEAQQNVAVEIAEAVRAALVDGDLSRAVNAPAIGGEEMRRIRPLLDLAQKLGLLASALSEGAPASVEVRYAGSAENALRPLAASALIGVLTSVVGRNAVNFVNAMHIAETRGIRLEQVRVGAQRDYAEYVELRVTDGEEIFVAGALLAEGHPRVVRIRDYHVDVPPRGTLVVLRNRDVPGVIGRVGTLLGDAGINIGGYHQSRRAVGGDALAAISVDGRLERNVVAALRALPEVIEVKQVELEPGDREQVTADR